MARISYVSLGCPKALVDSERILTTLRSEGYEISREHAGADMVIVNTCGFLDSAQTPSTSPYTRRSTSTAVRAPAVVVHPVVVRGQRVEVTGPDAAPAVGGERADRP